jgi:hypothetical protein
MSSPLDPSKSAAAEQPVVPSLEEQFHVFWQKNGTRVLAFCGAVALGIVAFYGYQSYQAGVDQGIGEKYAAAETTSQLQAFITANPNHQLAGVAQLRIADEAYAAGKHAEAIAAYDKAITMLPSGPFGARARLGAAMARISGGRTAEGEDALKKLAADTAQLAPLRAEATYQLFSLAQASGKSDDANKYLEQVFQLAPSSPWAQRAMAMRATVATPAAPAIPLAPAAK